MLKEKHVNNTQQNEEVGKTMKYHDTLREILSAATPLIQAISEAEMTLKPRPEKWSKKEILGHLIDSAYNNHQRFLRAEKQDNLIFQGYDPDDWVIKNDYQSRPTDHILNLWRDTNLHLGFLIANIPPHILKKETTEHNFHKICMNLLSEKQTTTLSYLIWDYLFHIEYHLAQIIPDYRPVNQEIF